MGWTRITRDGAGRPTTIERFGIKPNEPATPPSPWGDNTNLTGTISLHYDLRNSDCTGTWSRVTNEASLDRESCSDGMGRLIKVKEADGTATEYSYDVLDNLIRVSQNGQIRAFEYSSLGRLLKACNPEGRAGTVDCSAAALPDTGIDRYGYDPNGNLLWRQSADGLKMTVPDEVGQPGYDGLNRPRGMTYKKPDGDADTTPSVAYTYDGDWKGALSGVSSTIGSLTFGTSYTHDGFGRIATSKQTTAGVEYLFSYQYSLADQLTEIHYPSGRVVAYVPDSAGRVQYVRNGVTSTNYATMNYTPAGGVSSMAMGERVDRVLDVE